MASLIASTILLAGCAARGISAESADTESGENMAYRVVDNVDALRRVDGSVCSSVITEGYHERGDGGNSQYYADPTMKSLADNGGTIIVGNDGTRWRAVICGALPLKLFGAVGDGATDDTAAIKSWLGELKKGGSGYAAAGTYVFTEPITLPDTDDISIRGDGAQQTIFMYAGEKTDCDLFTVGTGKNLRYGWLLDSFSIDSKTKMNGGCGLMLNGLKHTNRIENVSFGRVNGQRGCNLWNGIFFNNCSLTDYVGFEIYTQNEGIMICGVADSDSGADISLDQGTITFTRVGIHLGGGFGGLYIGQVLIYGCYETGYLQDNSLCARGNREVIITDRCVLDACHSYCALIDDKLSEQCVMQFGAFISGAGWIEPATPGDGLYIKSMPNGRISVTSNHIKHCKGNGITIGDYTAYITVAPTTYLVGNGGRGIYSEKTAMRLKSDAVLLYNAAGDR
jgi:hypothetical protein